MTTPSIPKSAPILNKRHVGLATIAAFVGCAACCAVPLLAATGVGSGGVAALASVLRPGSELVVGVGVFMVALGVMTVRARLSRTEASQCGSSCRLDGSCCGRVASNGE